MKQLLLGRGFVVAVAFMVLNMVFFISTCSVFAGEKDTNDKKSKKEYQLEKMTVTAQKKEEDPQEVPMSISTLDDMEIEDSGIESVRDMADFVPNLSFSNLGRSHINEAVIRGIRSNANTGSSSVGLYIDGMPIDDPREYSIDIVNLERIEVLKGPQGTLYGKNTEAGVINIVTKKPDNHFNGRVSVEGGSDEKQKLQVAVNGPVKEDKLYFSFAGQYASKDGFLENTVTGNLINDRQSSFGKLGLRWTPTERLEVALNMSTGKTDDGGNSQNSLNAYRNLGRKVTVDFEGWNKIDTDAISLQVDYALSDNFRLVSVTSNRVVDDDTAGDYDYTDNPAYRYHYFGETESRTFSQELRGLFDNDKFSCIAGGYFGTRNKDFKETTEQASGTSISYSDKGSVAYSFFGQATLPVMDKLSLTAGLRYDYEEKDTNLKTAGEKMDDSWTELSPKVALSYQLAPGLLAYGSASSGHRSGGFNRVAPHHSQRSYKPEKLWSYETGIKNSLFDSRLILNGVLFYMDVTDMQVLENQSTGVSYFTNSGKATSKGIELEAKAIVADGLALSAGYGYADTVYDEFKDALGDYSGNQAIYASKHTFNLGAQYRHDSGIFVRGDVIGYSRIYLDKQNKYTRPAYEIVNLKIGYEGKRLDAYLYARNLFDEEYNEEGAFNGGYVHYSDPREIGVTLNCRF